jgi:hypothetical protein
MHLQMSVKSVVPAESWDSAETDDHRVPYAGQCYGRVHDTLGSVLAADS